MLKGSDPIYAATRSLEILSRFPEQVRATDGTGELMRKELTERKAVESLVSDALTQRLRRTLRQARRYYDRQTPSFPIEEARVSQAVADIKTQRLDHDFHKASLKLGVNAFKKAPQNLQKKIRTGIFDKEVYEFVYQAAFLGFRDAIKDFKLTDAQVEQLYLDKCLTARISMTSVLFAMQWFETSGADSLPKEDATNQSIDNDYVVCATYFDGVMSEEKRVNALYQKTMDLLTANYSN